MDTRPSILHPFFQSPLAKKLGAAGLIVAAVCFVAIVTWILTPGATPSGPIANQPDSNFTDSDQPGSIPQTSARRNAPAVRNNVSRPPAAQSSLSDIPPLEISRQIGEDAIQTPEGVFKIPSRLDANFECAFAPNAKKISDTHFVLDFENKYEWMFLFRLSGVTGKTIRIDCKNVPLNKWSTLNPVYRYANDGLSHFPPLLPDNYKLSNTKTVKARNGPLLPDTTGQAWHFIPDVWAGGGSTLSFVETFHQDSVTVAMKVPFTLEDEKALCEEAKKCPDAQVIDIGKTQEGRALHVIKISTGGEEGEKNHPCVLMYAREHADEHDSSWAVAGAMFRLLQNDPIAINLRNRFTFLFIPVLDADAVAHCRHENIIRSFGPASSTPESILYAKFFQSEMRKGVPLDLTLNFHNVESQESEHLVCPIMPLVTSEQYSTAISFHSAICSNFQKQDFHVTLKSWRNAAPDFRLADWLTTIYGTVYLPYEMNSQEPHRHLTVQELEFQGNGMVHAICTFLKDPDKKMLDKLNMAHAQYRSRKELYSKEIVSLNPFADEARLIRLESEANLLKAFIGGNKTQ